MLLRNIYRATDLVCSYPTMLCRAKTAVQVTDFYFTDPDGEDAAPLWLPLW